MYIVFIDDVPGHQKLTQEQHENPACFWNASDWDDSLKGSHFVTYDTFLKSQDFPSLFNTIAGEIQEKTNEEFYLITDSHFTIANGDTFMRNGGAMLICYLQEKSNLKLKRAVLYSDDPAGPDVAYPIPKAVIEFRKGQKAVEHIKKFLSTGSRDVTSLQEIWTDIYFELQPLWFLVADGSEPTERDLAATRQEMKLTSTLPFSSFSKEAFTDERLKAFNTSGQKEALQNALCPYQSLRSMSSIRIVWEFAKGIDDFVSRANLDRRLGNRELAAIQEFSANVKHGTNFDISLVKDMHKELKEVKKILDESIKSSNEIN